MFDYLLHTTWMKGICLCLCFSLAMLAFPLHLIARADNPEIMFKHDPLEFCVPRYRIEISAVVTEPNGIKLVRCYFKEEGQADFVFVDMAAYEKNEFKGILPAPAETTKSIVYSILAVTGRDEVYKTDLFSVPIKAVDVADLPLWIIEEAQGPILVKTENDDKPEAIAGFSDNITIDVVESALRFGGTGVVVGATTAESSAVSAHWLTRFTQSAGKQAWYNNWWVWAGAAAVVGGTAAVLASSGGGDDDDDSTATVTVSW